jgi:adenylyltransferase/sulfurtransferase
MRLRHALEWPADGDDAVLVVGAGALGAEVVDLLVHSGVRRIHVVDPDRVSESTVAHSLAARPADIGRYKVDCLADLYERGQASTHITPWRMLFEVFPEGVLRECSLVLGCVDSVRSRLRVSQACLFSGVPYLDGGLSDWGAGVSFFTPAVRGPCFRCVVSEAEVAEEAARFSCSDDENPAAATLSVQSTAAIAAGTMVQEALKLRAALPDAMTGGQHIGYSVRDVGFLHSWSPADPECALPHQPISVVQVETAATSAPEVTHGIASRLGISDDIAVLWPGAWAYCPDCAFESDPVEVRHDTARSLTVLCCADCSHSRSVALDDISGLPAWHATARSALDRRRLSVIGRAGTLAQHVILYISDPLSP